MLDSNLPPEDRSFAPETQALAAAARTGDGRSFERLYERIAPALYAWASLRIRPTLRASVDPADVVQEVWCRAWRRMAEFDPGRSSLRAWIFRIAKNVLLEATRKLERGRGADTLLLRNLPDSATEVGVRLARDESLARLLEWARGLDEDERRLFVHCGLEGLAYAEVAERLGISPDAVAKRWQRLRARTLRFALPDDLVAPE